MLCRAAYLQKRLSTVVGGMATATEVQPQAAVTEEDLAAVAARAGFSFAAPMRSQPLVPGPAAASGNGSGAADARMAGGDDAGDDSEGDDWAVGVTDGANDDSDSGSDIEDLDAILAAEEAAAAGGR